MAVDWPATVSLWLFWCKIQKMGVRNQLPHGLQFFRTFLLISTDRTITAGHTPRCGQHQDSGCSIFIWAVFQSYWPSWGRNTSATRINILNNSFFKLSTYAEFGEYLRHQNHSSSLIHCIFRFDRPEKFASFIRVRVNNTGGYKRVGKLFRRLFWQK